MFSSLRFLRPSTLFLRSSFYPTLRRIELFATWIPFYVFFNDHIAQLMWVTGPSMYPFLNTDYNSTTKKDVVFVNMWNPWKDLRRGMIVAFGSPYKPENLIIKRIIAVEGDEVITRPPYPFSREIVPVGHVWVEGEHPEDRKSLDSNTYGPIAKSLIVGKVQGIVWPFSKIARIKWQDYRDSPKVLKDRHNFDHQRMWP